VIHASDGRIKTFTANGDNFWADIGSAPLPRDGSDEVDVNLDSSGAHVSFNGTTVDLPAATPRLGLVANDGIMRFSDVTTR
jgi:hypothetical protein